MENSVKVLELFEKHKEYIEKRSNECIENHRKGNGVIKFADNRNYNSCLLLGG